MIFIDSSIPNTMNKELIAAKAILKGTKISIVDAARLVKSILDAKNPDFPMGNFQYCLMVVDAGKRNVRTRETSFAEAFLPYLESKKHLRYSSLHDIRCIGNRLLRSNQELAKRRLSTLSIAEIESWLAAAFDKAPQFNKACTMMHGFFEFAIRHDWCNTNPIKRVVRRKIIEREIRPLKLAETKKLIQNAKKENGNCAVTAALMVFGGIRPREVRRLKWDDIDTEECVITVRSQCSKTGGVRHVEIPPVLKYLLTKTKHENRENENVCPSDWERRWRKIRDNSGFRGRWVQDVLRHTYASFHAKHYADLPRLQLNMGHRDLSLLRSRYINMHGISRAEAKCFFDPKNVK